MYPHRIRLRGPWEYEMMDAPAGEVPSTGRIVMPCPRWDGPPGRVQFHRHFGYPGRIDAHERVWIVFDGLASPVRVSVNATDLGTHTGAVEVDVTHLLGSRNELTVELVIAAPSPPAVVPSPSAVVSSPPGPLSQGGRGGESTLPSPLGGEGAEVKGQGLWDEAALEVRCTAYLRNVQVKWVGGEIRATGEVVGSSEGLLELYLVADRSPAGYTKVDPAGGMQPFELRAEGTNQEGGPVGRVTIELIRGAVVWYTVERAVPE
jgi:hypothetical protein